MKKFASFVLFLTMAIGASAQCIADFNYNSNNDPTIDFNNNSTPNMYYYWDFGDGNTSSIQDPTHTYASNGTYLVCLVATDSFCTATTCDTLVITNAGGGGNCSVSYSYTSNDPTFTFTANGTGVPPFTYSWDFGDGGSGVGQVNTHTYTANGAYTTCVTLTDANGCSSTYCDSLGAVGVGGGQNCQAYFYSFIDSINPATIWVVDQSQGTNLSYFWDFGDGNTSNQQYPTHTYAQFGSYLLCLTVTDGQCTSTYCDSIAVYQRSNGFTLNIIPSGALGVDENTLEMVNNIYPNPVANEANLTLAASTAMQVDVMIYNVTGQMLAKTQHQLINGTNQLVIPTSNLESGAYLINVLDQTGTSTAITIPFIKR